MDFAMLALAVLGFGHLLRILKLDVFEPTSWFAKHEQMLKGLVNCIVLVGWFIVAYGRLMLYLSFVPYRGYVPLLAVIAMVEFFLSLHILKTVRKQRAKLLLGLDVAVTVGIAVLVIWVISSVDSIIII